MMHHQNTGDITIQGFLATLTERQIASLLLNFRRNPGAYPLTAARMPTIQASARREIARRRTGSG